MSDTTITNIKNKRGHLALAGSPVSVHGVELSVYDTGGRGPAVVCLHAAGHGSRDFEPLVQRMARTRRIVTLDWPSQGHSGGDPVPPDARRYAQLTLGVLDALGLGKVILLGCSVGGAAALTVAAEQPGRVAGLVLCNAGGLAKPTAIVRVFSTCMSWMYGRAGSFPWLFACLFALKYRILLRGPNAARQRARIIAAGPENADVLMRLWASFGRPVNDVRSLISDVHCPVWLAWARSDPFNSHHLIASALREFNAELTLFRGAHAPFLEEPDAFHRALCVFLARADMPSAGRIRTTRNEDANGGAQVALADADRA